jgi:glycosyltransferase involved in cell wall biosynthesis
MMHRYLSGLRHFDWRVITDQKSLQADFFLVDVPAWLQRLQHSRISRLAHTWAQLNPGRKLVAKVMEKSLAWKPDVIMTVAHGVLWPVAHLVARRWNIPLISIFMDWWPDMALCPDSIRPMIERRFRSLYQESAVTLCISPGMREELGANPKARLLYPAPPKPKTEAISFSPPKNGKFRMLYMGNMRDVYAKITQAAYEAMSNHPLIEIAFAGGEPEWPQQLTLQAKRSGAYLGFLRPEAKSCELESADALLIVMTWDPKAARRMRTSFPSKTQEYCQAGKPIIVWAPKESSVARWALETGAACLVTSPDVAELVSTVKKLAADASERQRLAAKALECARTLFNPDLLQAQFEDALLSVVNRTPLAGSPIQYERQVR